MNEFTVETSGCETYASGSVLMKAVESEVSYAAYVGLDVHKETIAVAVAYLGRGAPESRGEIANRPKALAKLIRRGKDSKLVMTAVARELAGFVWAIVREIMPQVNQHKTA